MKTLCFSAYMLLVLMLVGVLQAQVVPCSDCPQPDRPWMRGTVEISCALPAKIAELQQAKPEATIMACACQHQCDPFDDHAEETGDRAWDHKCAARCSPSGCQCPNPCAS